jgi:hypothetical protein
LPRPFRLSLSPVYFIRYVISLSLVVFVCKKLLTGQVYLASVI